MNKNILLILFFFIPFGGIIAQNSKQSDFIFPTQSWEKLEQPDTLGWDIEKLFELQQFVNYETNLTGLMIIYNGKVLFEFGDTKEVSDLASCRKSVLSIMYGKYVENGIIDLHKTIGELGIDDVVKLSETEKTATIKDLMTSRSGVYHLSTNTDRNSITPTRNSKQPGTYFIYNNWDFNVAGYIFEQQMKMDIYDALEKELAKPLQFEDWDKNKQEREVFGDHWESKYPPYHMWLSTRDMARIGYLMLRNGEWNGEQLVPKEWIRKTTSLITPVKEVKISEPRVANWDWWKWGYGYMWRVWDPNEEIRDELKGAYSATGAWGQYITIIPSLNLVVAAKTKSEYRRGTNKETYLTLIDKLVDSHFDFVAKQNEIKNNLKIVSGKIIDVRMNQNSADFFKYKFEYKDKEYFGWSCTNKDNVGGKSFLVSFDSLNPNHNNIDLDYQVGKFMDNRDSKTYRTIEIGKQKWLAENFAYIPFVCELDSNKCGVWVYGYNGTNVEYAKSTIEYQKYGCLYSWEQAKQLCPEGWHLPTDEDWSELEKFIGISGLINDTLLNHITWRGENQADLLKKGGQTGFDILFAGWRGGTGKFNNVEIHANFWVDTETSEYGAMERLFNSNSGKIGKYWGNKDCGFSVRYIKDKE